MTAMLATHGFAKGTFVGHSYGTTWLSYMCKYAPTAVAALFFLDPICFCLHGSRLTKNFVYLRPDPGTSSFMVRTDIIVNWTIQRSFPWAWITLFVDQINVPCTVILSDKDALVPVEKVEQYFRKKKAPVCDFQTANKDFFETSGDLNVCVDRGACHGGWAERPGSETVALIAEACNVLCRKAEKANNDN
jgi:pimeloyl-ACP methyl ester carboxylesterase